MKKVVVFLASALLVATPMIAAAATTGIVGDCSDCHTMHNSIQGQKVAKQGLNGTLAETGIQNLLKFDCIACHANPDATSLGTSVYTMPGGSLVPQVYGDFGGDDLAAGNFWYSDDVNNAVNGSQRHGHNVKDLIAADNSNADSDGAPPGFYHASSHGKRFTTDLTNNVAFGSNDAYGAFTCAGARGCHGVRFQLLGNTSNVQADSYRTGIAAISGAHHNSQDGAKTPGQVAFGVENGQEVADGYRFIPGLKGYGNETDRWKNVDENSHNEYYGVAGGINASAHCEACHEDGASGHTPSDSSVLMVPNQSMSGFCSTCHGMFHSGGVANMDFSEGANPPTPNNGVAGAFLRHPSDFVIPNDGEYAAYQTYDVSAPVARSTVLTAASAIVTPGSDMVMCLSCHEAHATPNDFMLRFQYQGNMKAGAYANVAAAQNAGGCLACHTEKGVLPQSR